MMPALVAIMLSVGEFATLLAGAASIALARPKSSTLTLSSGVILMFAGFRSRWTMPFSCAASSASAICSAIASASSIGIGAVLQPLGQRLPFDQFHDQEVLAVPIRSMP